MTRFERLLVVFAELPPKDGWTCLAISNRWVTLHHPARGTWICRVSSRDGLVMEQAPRA